MVTISSQNGLILSHSRRLRLFTLFILYVGQGLPIGLFWFAIPAWMAANGASAKDVGSVVALTALPWSLKFVNGFFMDRYTFLPMGRRRIWLLGAQTVMIAALCAAILLDPGVGDVAVLGAIGFVVNMATTFQDVAVDGLAVDIMEEDERARGSGMMFGGQSIGIAVATALTGAVIGAYGAPAAYAIVAGLILLLCLYILAFNEREGERKLPWQQGTAHPRNLEMQVGAWWPILKSTLSSLFKMPSVLWAPVLMGRGLLYGGLTGATPLIGSNYLGWNETEISSLTAAAGLVAGILCLTLGGWLGDRYGAKRTSIGWLIVQLAMCTTMYFSVSEWNNELVFMAFVYAWISLDLLLTVSCLPISMRLCDPRVAATQFTIYMAISNFGISIGAFALSRVDSFGGLPSIFLVVGAGMAVALTLLLFARYPRRPEFYAALAAKAEQLPHDDRLKPRID
ncbi:MFS transporter [Altererythrobacter litoralis]|uniref:MFS transporter n=1 Tax=Altererythrobacter litoralis TaxID=3113904 RepID=A0ABU7GE11_9SPHN|nr:MFS transporter [Erythrobacteraceae bacterium 1XM1-14]